MRAACPAKVVHTFGNKIFQIRTLGSLTALLAKNLLVSAEIPDMQVGLRSKNKMQRQNSCQWGKWETPEIIFKTEATVVTHLKNKLFLVQITIC